MDEHGFMYYREDVLVDLSLPTNTFKFSVEEESYFRAYTMAHRIDLDLKLYNSTKIVYGYKYGSREEGIQFLISPGNYTFQLILYGKYGALFCETAMLEISIAPKSLYSNPVFDVCTGQPSSRPDKLLTLNQSLINNPSFTLPYDTYRYIYSGSNQNQKILETSFNITVDSYIQAQLGSNFLLGDIRLWLITTTNSSNSTTQLGYHRRNMHFLDLMLPKSFTSTSYTTYTLAIVTADTQGTGAYAGFPPCATYSLSMTITPANVTGLQLCLANRPFPSNLNAPQFLNTSPKIHIQEEFLVPKIDGLYARQQVKFGNITTMSYFRFYTEPHHIDIDLKLEENGITVAQAINFNEEEVIAWVLKPGAGYTLTITYFKWHFVDHGDDPCFTYQAELAITPMSENFLDNCSSTSIPQDLGKIVDPIYFEQDCYFTQTVDPSDISVNFEVTVPALFRALVSYDFVWNDLALRLDVPGSSDPVQGELGYNKNEISLLQLSPGNYTIHIYEPFNTTVAKSLALRNCVRFHLTVGLELIDDHQIDPLLLSCKDQYFPSTFNAPSFLSPLTGDSMDFNRYVLADVTDRSDSVSFVLNATSSFRIYIPVHQLLDIDVVLSKGSSPVSSQTSYGKEEAIMMSLVSGSYTLKFSYYGLAFSSILPPPSACVAFRVEISIYPVSTWQAIPALTSSCDTNFLTQSVDPTTTTTWNFTRSLETQMFFYAYTVFTVKTTSLLTVKFEQSDATSGVAMLLKAMNISKTYIPLYFQNRIYLNEHLVAGTYNLSFHDPFAKGNIGLQCGIYQLTYSLVIEDIPAGECDADALPTVLNTTAGGSLPYGGPQEANGYIHLYGDNFVMPKGAKNKHNYILISAKTKSYLRMFLAVDPGNSITANLFKNTNLTSSSPLVSTIAAGAADRSNVWTLPGQNGYYVLDLYFTTISNSLQCNLFTLELVVEPETDVLAGLACPNPLPTEMKQMPPETITLYKDQTDWSFSNSYLITSSRYTLNSRNNSYTYTMTISVSLNYSFSAMIGYDFVVNEFALLLQDTSGHNLTTGIHQESPATDDDVNFMNYLEWKLTPGTYRLRIVDVGAKTFNLTTFCHYFTFAMSFSAISVNNTGPARVLNVNPPSGSDLNPQSPLSIVITFSEAAKASPPVGYSLVPYFAEYGVVYLKTKNGNITAVEAFFDSSNTQLHLRFTGPFEFGLVYSLVFDNTKFVTRSNGTTFDGGPAVSASRTYAMHSCLRCSDHGTCAQKSDNSWTCVCIGNWTGSNCDRCADGFHAAGVLCVPNTYCSTNSCNSNGACNDASGYVVCLCAEGFSGTACDTCAPGYSGYPNCTTDSTDTDESESCTAPLLPTTLNTPAFLNYTGHLHMQGWYYINQQAKVHDTRFSLTVRSLYRIYSETNEIDVDLWLYKVGADGTLSSLAYKISFGLEETTLTILDAGDYLIRFKYYFWVKPSSDCATFNLELAIAPLASVISETSYSKSLCASLPTLANLNVTTPYDFSQTGYSVSAPSNKSTATSNYFYRLNITIAPPVHHVAIIHATVGYRFLPGDVSILLEAGTKGTHCASTSFSLTPPAGCTYGDNLQNLNTLHAYLEPGAYVLWIYEPVRQLPDVSTCSPFDFSLAIDFVADEQDIFSCNLPPIPLSLDSSQYTEGDGYIHFQDEFVLDVDRAMGFNVTQSSYMRAVITGDDYAMILYNATSGVRVATNGDEQNVLAALPAGSYYLQFTADLVGFCPILSIEFALAPVNINDNASCTDRSEYSPDITITSPNFNFGPTRNQKNSPIFYTFHLPSTPVVQSYTFTLPSPGSIDTGVQSDFLRGNLHLELYKSGRLALYGDNDYNYNTIQETLTAGNYELRIVLPPGQRISSLPSCIAYNFELHLNLTSGGSVRCNSNALPYSLNTMRYLGNTGTMNYQSENWRIPPSLTFAGFHDMNFTVPVQSLIRVYTAPHSIDIDIRILSSTNKVLASGSNAISSEESLTYLLDANVTYTFQLQFYNFGGASGVSACSSFNMEIEIGPIPARQLICPNSGSLWPDSAVPSTLPLPYYYSSIDSSTILYYQQISKTKVSRSYNFTLNAAANVHIEIGYDFLVGELVLRLDSIATKTRYFGSNKIDRNIVNIVNIPKGKYTLTIYEPSINLDSVIACSKFTFAFYAEEYSTLISTDRFMVEYYLPSSLDSISYLLVSNKTHIANNFYMFDGSGEHESTTFTVKQPSFLRVDSILLDSQVSSGGKQAPVVSLIRAGTSLSTNNASLLISLQPGQYTLKFTPPNGLTEEDDMGVIVSVQIAIDTVANVQAEVGTVKVEPTCPTQVFNNVQISPGGYYEDGSALAYVSYALLSTKTDIAKIPFTLDRYSIVYLQVGAQFLVNELSTRLSTANGTMTWHGRMRKNINELHQGLPAGNYFAYISQSVVQADSSLISHCGLFSYAFLIKDATDPGVIVDCTALQTLPWQLDSVVGGSAPYGGPISSDGTIHLYGDHMHVPMQSNSFINFTLSKTSLISVLVLNYPSNFLGIDFTLLAQSGSTQTPTYAVSSSSDRSRLSVFELSTSSSSVYQLGVAYRRGSSVQGLCYTYTLQIDIAPASAVQNRVTCPLGMSGQTIPATIILDPVTNSASDSIDSFFQGWSAVKGLSQTTNFTTKAPSTSITVSFAYYSLVTAFTMKLVNAKTNSVISSAQIRGQPTFSGKTNVYLFLSTTVGAGSYSILITHPSATAPFIPTSRVCAPFILNYQIQPKARVDIDVKPPNVDGLSTEENLVLTISFTGNVYSATKKQITSVNSSYILGVFYLSGSDDSRISPSSAQVIDVYSRQWKIMFPILTGVTVTYTLKLAVNQLYDSSNTSISLSGNYQYVTLTCGAHGTFSTDVGKCQCQAGYAGLSCDSCDTANGYAKVFGTEVCVKEMCQPNTCNCLDPPACQTKLGLCYTNTSGQAHCSCSQAYMGEHCEVCKTGYSNWPNCAVFCSPACIHGACLPGGVCQCFGNWVGSGCDTCPSNFKGDSCDQCADDFYGVKCDEYKASGSDLSATKKFLEIAGAIVIVALVVAGAFWYWRYRRAGSRYQLVSRFNMDDDDEMGHTFPDVDNRIVDDDTEEDASARNDQDEEVVPTSASIN